MSTFNALPEVILSKNGAKYLLKRNASEKELFKKQTWLLDKAKSKEERAFCRERERLLQRRLSRFQGVGERVKRITEDESDKWEVQSDTPCYIKHRRKQGIFLDSSPLWSSQDSVCPSSGAYMSQRGPGVHNCDEFLSSPSVVRKFKRAISEQYSSTSSRTSSPRSTSCVLPPISLQCPISGNEGERKLIHARSKAKYKEASFIWWALIQWRVNISHLLGDKWKTIP